MEQVSAHLPNRNGKKGARESWAERFAGALCLTAPSEAT